MTKERSFFGAQWLITANQKLWTATSSDTFWCHRIGNHRLAFRNHTWNLRTIRRLSAKQEPQIELDEPYPHINEWLAPRVGTSMSKWTLSIFSNEWWTPRGSTSARPEGQARADQRIGTSSYRWGFMPSKSGSVVIQTRSGETIGIK